MSVFIHSNPLISSYLLNDLKFSTVKIWVMTVLIYDDNPLSFKVIKGIRNLQFYFIIMMLELSAFNNNWENYKVKPGSFLNSDFE